MSRVDQLQVLVNKIPRIQHMRVDKRGNEYFVREGEQAYFYFQTFQRGQIWLNQWIATNKQPPMSNLTIR